MPRGARPDHPAAPSNVQGVALLSGLRLRSNELCKRGNIVKVGAALLVVSMVIALPALGDAGNPCVDTQLCIRGFHWSPSQCRCVPDGSCEGDTDCRAFSDYCSGCDCRALSAEQPDPACAGPGVQCFADPCLGTSALCVNGQCTLGPCIDTQLCIRGFRWSPERCACVPIRPHPPHVPRNPSSPHNPHQPHTPGSALPRHPAR
jgi:hypothetical protein